MLAMPLLAFILLLLALTLVAMAVVVTITTLALTHAMGLLRMTVVLTVRPLHKQAMIARIREYRYLLLMLYFCVRLHILTAFSFTILYLSSFM